MDIPMSRKFIDLQAIHDHWEALGRCQDVADNGLTHRDVWQRWLEIETIKKFLSPDDRLLDVGCGNGFSTLAIGPLVRKVVGIDSGEAMIKRAQDYWEHSRECIGRNHPKSRSSSDD